MTTKHPWWHWMLGGVGATVLIVGGVWIAVQGFRIRKLRGKNPRARRRNMELEIVG